MSTVLQTILKYSNKIMHEKNGHNTVKVIHSDLYNINCRNILVTPSMPFPTAKIYNGRKLFNT